MGLVPGEILELDEPYIDVPSRVRVCPIRLGLADITSFLTPTHIGTYLGILHTLGTYI